MPYIATGVGCTHRTDWENQFAGQRFHHPKEKHFQTLHNDGVFSLLFLSGFYLYILVQYYLQAIPALSRHEIIPQTLNLSLKLQWRDLAQWEMVYVEQSLQVMSKQERLENWTARIMACRGSGMTVRAWCQENGLSEKTYYYWQRRLFQTLSEQQQAIQQPAFAEIAPAPNVRPSCGVAVTVQISGVEAEIYNGADAATVETVLRILKSC